MLLFENFRYHRNALVLLCILFFCFSCAQRRISSEKEIAKSIKHVDYTSMSDVALGRYMYQVAGEPFISASTLPISLERYCNSYEQMVYGKVTSTRLNREEILKYIKGKRVGPIYKEIEMEVYRHYPPATLVPEKFRFRYCGNTSILGGTHDPDATKGKKYIVFLKEADKDKYGDITMRCAFAPVNSDNLVHCVIETQDPFHYFNAMPVDTAWDYLVNCLELNKGRGTPITGETVSHYLTSNDTNMFVCGILLSQRQGNASAFASVVLERMVHDITKKMFSSVEARIYGSVVRAALPLLTAYCAEAAVEPLLNFYCGNVKNIFHDTRSFNIHSLDREVLLLIITSGEPLLSERLERFVKSIHAHRGGEAKSAYSNMRYTLRDYESELLLFNKFASELGFPP